MRFSGAKSLHEKPLEPLALAVLQRLSATVLRAQGIHATLFVTTSQSSQPLSRDVERAGELLEMAPRIFGELHEQHVALEDARFVERADERAAHEHLLDAVTLEDAPARREPARAADGLHDGRCEECHGLELRDCHSTPPAHRRGANGLMTCVTLDGKIYL